MAKRGLPLVGPRIAQPCEASWHSMQRAAGGRHCESCNRTVFDFTRSTAREIVGMTTLYGSNRLCGRLRVDLEGRAVLPDGVESGSHRRSNARAALGSSLLVFASACSEVPVRSPSPPAPAIVEAPALAPSAPPSAPALAPLDSDGDGVVDENDRCPNEPGTNTDGCARRVVVESNGDMVVLEQPRFQPDSARVMKEGEPILDAVVSVLKEHPEIHLVEVHGHTDATERGADKLSRERAEHVVDWLVKHGADRTRLVPIGNGHDMPLETNATAVGRERNRRVEFRVVPDAAQTSI